MKVLIPIVLVVLSPHLAFGGRGASDVVDKPPSSCGELAIRLLSSYFGADDKPALVKERLRENERGECSLADLQDYLSSIGIESQGFEATVEELRIETHPVVLLMRREPQALVGHFVVARSDGQRIIAYDPAYRAEPYELTPDALSRYWSGRGLIALGRPGGPRVARGWIFAMAVAIAVFGCAIVYVARRRRDSGRCARHHSTTAVMSAFIALVASACWLEPTLAGSLATVDSMEQDAGVIEPAQLSLDRTFTFKNTSTSSLTIERVLTSCHCTSVSFTKGQIVPGDSVPIQVHIDMRAWRGNGAAGILVRFKDERHPPVAYKVTFYRPAPLQPNPTTVEFGIDDGTGRSTRTFRLLWAAEAKRAGIKILAGIRSEKGAVDCRLVSQREQVKRLVNAEQDSRYQEFEFEVRLLAGQHPGRGEDSIIVPVMIDGLKSAMVVPVHYTTRGQLFSSPDRWVGVVPEGPCAIDLHLYRADGQPAPSELSVSCTDEAVELAYHALSQVHGPELGVIHATLKSRPSDKGRLDATIAIGAQVGKDSVRLEIPVTLILAPRPPAESSHDKDMAEFDAAEVQASAASAAAAPLPWSQDSDAANERERLVSEINDAGIPIRDFMAVLKDPPSQWEPRASKAIPALRRAMADIDRLGQLDPRLAARMANIHDASLVCLLALHDPVGISRAEAMKNGGENDQVISAAAKLIARAVTGSHEAKDQSVFIKQLIKLDYAHATSDRLAGLTVMLYEYAATPELASDLKGALKSMQGRIPTEIRNAEVAGDRLRSLVGSRLVIAGTTTDGKAFEIGAMRGRVVLIDFWASWCAPCRAEIPTIQNLYRRYHSKGLEVVGISNDYDPAELKNFVTRNRIPWPQLFDPKAAADGQWHPITVSLGIEGIPRVLLIGKQGRLEAIDLGDHGDAVIEKLLAE